MIRPLMILALAAFALQAAAAELPSRQAKSPQQAARKCEIDGKPGVLVGESDVCVKISGYISGQAEAGSLKK